MIKVGYSIKRKISDGDYGSYDVGAWMEAEVSEGECPKAMTNELAEMCKNKLKEEVKQIRVNIEYANIQKGKV